MKIALLHTHFGGPAGGGGGVRQMTELARNLADLGHEATVCIHDHDSEDAFTGASEGFEVRSVEQGPYAIPVGARRALKQIWLQMPRLAKIVPADVDVINAHEFPAIHAGRIAARRLGVPLVWTRNDYTVFEFALIPDETPVEPMSILQRSLRAVVSAPDARAARAADSIVVLDQRNRRMVARCYRREAEIIRSGPAPHFYDARSKTDARARLGIPEDDFVVLGVGILMPMRRFDDLIDAVASLGPRSNAKTRIIGSDHIDPTYADHLDQRIAGLGLADRVTLIRGAVSEDQLSDSYAAADLFVFPNSKQTWGLAPLEAIAARTPVVVSRGAGVHEVLEGRAGVQLVDALAPDQLAEAIIRVESDPASFEVESTRDWVRENLNNRTYAENMLELFERVTS
ncbi:MAG: glycosyltransferase family 4 protein [Solirubrobacterales bacterium]